jgi:hypothetical protein
MVWQRIRFALLAGAIVAAAAHTARAADAVKSAPANLCTIKVVECVPETYTGTRTVYKTECREEKFTAYRCESVPEVRTRTCTVYKQVAETKTVNRTYWVCVPVVEERTVMKPVVSYHQVTKMVCKTEDHGHYECREVTDHWGCFKQRLHRHGHKHSCCDCGDCCEAKPVKIKKVWVPCKVTVQVPTTVCERVCTMQPSVCKVTTYKREQRTEAVNVTVCKCVPETREEKYTVCVTHKVPYHATRTVRVCVPHQETYTCTRMVSRVVEKQVPVVETCAAPCEETCAPAHKCHRHKHHRHHKSCCD